MAQHPRLLIDLDPAERPAGYDRSVPVGIGRRVLIGVIGVLFVGLGIWALIGALDPLTSWSRTTGTVVASEDDAMGLPGISFLAADGTVIRFTDAIGTAFDDLKAGQDVMVSYDPDAPAHARVYSPFRLLAGPVAFVVIGLVPLVLAATRGLRHDPTVRPGI
jgi:hypothetical protein